MTIVHKFPGVDIDAVHRKKSAPELDAEPTVWLDDKRHLKSEGETS